MQKNNIIGAMKFFLVILALFTAQALPSFAGNAANHPNEGHVYYLTTDALADCIDQDYIGGVLTPIALMCNTPIYLECTNPGDHVVVKKPWNMDTGQTVGAGSVAFGVSHGAVATQQNIRGLTICINSSAAF